MSTDDTPVADDRPSAIVAITAGVNPVTGVDSLRDRVQRRGDAVASRVRGARRVSSPIGSVSTIARTARTGPAGHERGLTLLTAAVLLLVGACAPPAPQPPPLGAGTEKSRTRGAVSVFANHTTAPDRQLICNVIGIACDGEDGLTTLKRLVDENGGANALVDIVVAMCREIIRAGCDIIELQDEDVRSVASRLERLLDRTEALVQSLADPDDDEDDEQPEY